MFYAAQLNDLRYPQSVRRLSALAQWRVETIAAQAVQAFVVGGKLFE